MDDVLEIAPVEAAPKVAIAHAHMDRCPQCNEQYLSPNGHDTSICPPCIKGLEENAHG